MANYNPVMINHERAAAVNINARDAQEFIKKLPPGYRFCPTDEEIVVEYLMKKANDQPLPIDIMPVVEINQQSPDELASTHAAAGDGVWYFLTTLDRKYKNGKRPSRTSSDHGYWKPTGADKPVSSGDLVVGYKKTLDYYTGKQKEGNNTKTGWKMHEYRTKQHSRRLPEGDSANNMKLDGIVLCKIYKNERGKKDDQDGASITNSPDANSGETKKLKKDPAPSAQPNNGTPTGIPAPESSNCWTSVTNINGASSSVRVEASFFHRTDFLRPHKYTYDQRFIINQVPFGSNMPPSMPIGNSLTPPSGSPNYSYANDQLAKNAETRNEAPLMQATSTDHSSWPLMPKDSFFDTVDDFRRIDIEDLFQMFDDDASGQNMQKKI